MNSTTFVGPVMIDISGTTLTDLERERISNPLVGGLILFSRNYISLAQLDELVADIRQVKQNIIIAVDHEGGRVQRFRSEFTLIPPMASLGSLYIQDVSASLAASKELGWLMSSELRAHDIDISFAPVMDRDHGISQVIGDRAFSDAQSSIVALTRAFIEGMHEAGMASTGKHFPGHGAVEADSHHAIPIDNRSFETISEQDMTVFSEMANRGMDAVMPAHVIYPHVDDVPAGFSHRWVQNILRKDLGFDGVVFSDDLSMEGASIAGSFEDRADAALSAGCDMVLVCNDPDAADTVLNHFSDFTPSPLSSNRLRTMLGANRLPALSREELVGSERYQRAVCIAQDLRS